MNLFTKDETLKLGIFNRQIVVKFCDWHPNRKMKSAVSLVTGEERHYCEACVEEGRKARS